MDSRISRDQQVAPVYCCGFMFCNNTANVILIEKRRPQWQTGLLNGIGGHVMAGEDPRGAMVREFLEEVGIETSHEDWEVFARGVHADQAIVHFFRHWGLEHDDAKPEAKTDELPIVVDVTELWNHAVIANLHWLIPMALDGALDTVFDFRENAARFKNPKALDLVVA